MAYKVVPIGKEFTPKAIQALEERIAQDELAGWEFVFAFPVTQRTCIFMRSETYLMVLRKR